MKKKKWRKLPAFVLVFGLLAGMLGACGKGGQDGQEAGGAFGQGEEGGPDAGSGRYVEREVKLPSELENQAILQIFKAEDSLHLLTAKQQGEKTFLREWSLQGDSFTDVTGDWLAGLELPGTDWIEAELLQGGEGVRYLYAGYVAEGEDSFRGHLWKGSGASAEEITPEKWTVPDEQWGSYEMVQGLAALDNGTLAVLSYTSLDLFSGEDGQLLESESPSAFYEGGVVTDGENIYLCSSDGGSGQIEKRKEGKGADAVTYSYPNLKADSDTEGGADNAGGFVVVGGAGSLALDVLKDGTLYAANENGIFRLPGNDPEGKWELLAEGIETMFSMPDCYCTGLCALENGLVYAVFQADGEQKLNCYEYDPDAVSEVTTELKLYTVHESSLLKQAAALYHKAHPEVRITIESEYPLYYDGIPDYDAVYKKLNTMLTGGDAPDILVLDHLNIDSYASKGLLADLEDVVRPMEESGELLSNITGAYVTEDGRRYVVPLQFGFTLVLGRDIAREDMESMESLADFLGRADYSYMGNRTPAELADDFYPYFCDKIVNEKQLDKEVLGKYLEYLKKIADNCGVITQRSEDEISLDMWDLAGKAKLALTTVSGFTDCMFPMTMADYIKGDYTAFENRFIPSEQVGICAKSEYQDTAKDFLKFALSCEVQDSDYYRGFPVNKLSLKTQAEKDRSDMSAVAAVAADDGGYIEFESKPYSRATAEALTALCEKLDAPVKEDAKIRETLIECLGGYLDGALSLEQTIQKMEDGLKMYLAE
ncbi:MAG: extracellular solute-binding protein [Butyrivibrio sp.]|nr:extracellular solute-binding protein [Acetatifactor muris]MCM1560760.1 extracellular solute-binding protein [Butyrivibrio sp.]